MKKNNFSVIIPVAGGGTRLRPHTHTFPKVLLTVGHKPMLGHILDQITEAGMNKIYLVVGYLGDKIKSYVEANYSTKHIEFIEQPEPKGLGHAVWLASAGIQGPVFILLGDTIISADLSKLTDSKHDCIAVKAVPDPRRFGVVEVKKGFVSALVEKPEQPKSDLAIVGAYSFHDCAALHGHLSDLIQAGKTTRGEIQLTDAIMAMVKEGRKIVPVTIDGWYDCGKPSALLETNRYFLDKHWARQQLTCESNLVIAPSYVSPSAKVTNSIIGPYASIGDHAEINSSIVRDSIVNESACIKSMILNDSLIGPRAVLVGRKSHLNIGENSEIYFDSSDSPHG